MNHFGVNDLFKDASFVIKPLQDIVDQENTRLKKGFPITEVLNSFITRTDAVLRQTPQSQQIPQIRKHVPEWAWISFAVCGVLFILMAVG
jgi:flagellar biosynthesis/type III secretory pathway chaperone